MRERILVIRKLANLLPFKLQPTILLGICTGLFLPGGNRRTQPGIYSYGEQPWPLMFPDVFAFFFARILMP